MVIDALVRVNPGLRAILMVRNPILRAWSHMKKDLLNVSYVNEKKRDLAQVPREEIEKFLTHPYQKACGNYTATIDLWRSRLRAGNLLVGFFDDIYLTPESLLLDVFRFLGVEAHRRFLTPKCREFIFAADEPERPRPITPEWYRFLDDLFGEERDKLQRRFGRQMIR